MRHPPAFWSAQDSMLARALTPLEWLVARQTARRVARPGWRAPAPVLCCGNATVGGAGKTTVALDLIARLVARSERPHALLRGYGGRAGGGAARPVRPDDSAAEVGDEALLLAAAAPTWIGADRAAAARAAIAAGASCLVLDDGLQNPTLIKTASVLVVDGGAGFGNGRVVPAGPLREPVATAASRCTAAVLIGADVAGARAQLPPDLPVLTARLTPDAAMQALTGKRVFAFAGIGRPDKFFASLREAGAIIVGTAAFPDHHSYTDADATHLRARAAAAGATLATTPKDTVRLPPSLATSTRTAGVRLAWDDVASVERLLDQLLDPSSPGR
jgi:tetraacyldisaccharide 4'-kinase